MRIAIVATHPIQYHAPWFRALVAEGVELHVLFSVIPGAAQQATGFGGAFEWDLPLLTGYPWSVLPQGRRATRLGSFFGLRNREIGRVLSALEPDVVLLTGWNALPLLQGLFAAIRLGIPTLVRGESNSLRRRPAWKETGHRALLAFYDGVVSIGRANTAFYERSGVPPERIVEGGYFVDEDHFRGARDREMPRRDELRKSWNIPTKAFCLLFVGKLQEKKRPLDFVGAIAAAAQRLPPGAIHGLVVGSGELAEEAEKAAELSGAPITFAGFLNQSEIGRAYAAADVLVLPSDWGETWGLVVNEAMTFGRAAIVSDRVGCAPDLVEDGVTGRVFRFGDVPALASCIVDLAMNPTMARAMGQRALERIGFYSPRRGAAATITAARIVVEGR